MQSKEFTNTKKLDYEKPKIKEEVPLEQQALACSPAPHSVPGEIIGCTKSSGTSGIWSS